MGFFKTIGRFKDMPSRFFNAFIDVRGSYKVSKSYWDSKCIFFYGNKCRIVPAKVGSNMEYIEPKGVSIRVENKFSYFLEPENVPVFLVDLENNHSFKIGDEVPEQDIIKAIETVKWDEEKGKLTKSVDLKKYRYKGAQFTNEMNYKIMRTSLLRFMDEHGKKETILIILVSMLFGSVVTFVINILMFA